MCWCHQLPLSYTEITIIIIWVIRAAISRTRQDEASQTHYPSTSWIREILRQRTIMEITEFMEIFRDYRSAIKITNTNSLLPCVSNILWKRTKCNLSKEVTVQHSRSLLQWKCRLQPPFWRPIRWIVQEETQQDIVSRQARPKRAIFKLCRVVITSPREHQEIQLVERAKRITIYYHSSVIRI